VLGWSGLVQKGEGKTSVHGLEARGLRRTLVAELWPESVVSFEIIFEYILIYSLNLKYFQI
jgi:hypothetical protein